MEDIMKRAVAVTINDIEQTGNVFKFLKNIKYLFKKVKS